ncbi:hypothetical protein YC2023_099041 [Brassica napus]
MRDVRSLMLSRDNNLYHRSKKNVFCVHVQDQRTWNTHKGGRKEYQLSSPHRHRLIRFEDYGNRLSSCLLGLEALFSILFGLFSIGGCVSWWFDQALSPSVCLFPRFSFKVYMLNICISHLYITSFVICPFLICPFLVCPFLRMCRRQQIT